MSETVAIFGSSGFIGQHLLAMLTSNDVDAISVLRPSSPTTNIASLRPERYDQECIAETLGAAAVTSIVNLASYGVMPNDRDVSEALTANTFLPPTIVGAAERIGASVVHIGTCSEYASDGSTDAIDENAPAERDALYGATKAAGMIAAHAAAKALGVAFVGLRLFNVYGPGEKPHRLFPSLMGAFDKGMPARLSSGLQVRDFVHVDDVCRAILQSIRHAGRARSQEVWNVATGEGTSIRNFCKIVAHEAGRGDEALDFGGIALRPDDVPRVVGDPTRINRTLEWYPEIALQQGLAQMTRDWMQGRSR